MSIQHVNIPSVENMKHNVTKNKQLLHFVPEIYRFRPNLITSLAHRNKSQNDGETAIIPQCYKHCSWSKMSIMTKYVTYM